MARTVKSESTGTDHLPKLSTTLAFVCHDILELAEESPIILAMRENGVVNFRFLNVTTEEEIKSFTYTPIGTKAPVPLMPALAGTILSIRQWNALLTSQHGGKPLSEQQWREIDPVEYDVFLNQKQSGQFTLAQGPSSTTKSVDLVAEFKKGIKRDASLYPVLKDNRHWNNWQRAVLAQAHAHDIQEVFDVNYVPKNEEERNLFDEKNKFAYAMLNRTVQTDEGKAYVRQHERDFNASEVYRKLLDFATTSTAAELNKDSLIKYLTTIKLDSRWSGTTVGFILHWSEQMRLLDDMSLMEEQFTPPVRKRMLETAVENIPELANVKEIDTNCIVIGGTPLTFDQYRDTLLSAATRRNERIKPTSSRNKRVVQAHAYDYGDYGDDKDGWYEQGYVDTGENYVDTFVNQHTLANRIDQRRRPNTESSAGIRTVSYTHLTLPTNREV